MKWKGPGGLALGAVLATAAIGLGGVAVAASTGDERAADFAEALSAQTGQQITAEDVKAAQLQVLKDRLAEAVAAGDLTQEQADEMLERAENGDGPGFGPGLGFGPGPEMHVHGFGAVGDALESLGLQEDAARQAREDGKTLAEYAEGEGVSRAKLIEALKSKLTAEATEHGREADADRIAELADAIADGEGPGPERGLHVRGFGAVGDALESLGLDEEAARQAREDGKTLAEYAEGEGVSRAKLIEALKTELTAEAGERGREADAERIAELAEAIADGEGGPGGGPGGPVIP